MNRRTALIAAAITVANAAALHAETYFKEDFTNYGDKAPGVIAEGTDVINDPIHGGGGRLAVNVENDSDIFLSPIPLPAGKPFDLFFAFDPSGTNAEVSVVFSDKNGKSESLPFTGFERGKSTFAAKVAGGEIKLFRRNFTNLWAEVSKGKCPSDAAYLNFRAKAGSSFVLTDIEIRSPGPLPETPALDQFPAIESITRGLGAEFPASDASPLDILGKSISFTPGSTGVCATIELTWDTGFKQSHIVSVGSTEHSSPIRSYPMPQLGLKPGEKWHGRDAVIDFGKNGALARQHVRPSLIPYSNYRILHEKGVDVVRDWDLLPPASRHLVTFELRTREDGTVEVWVDGSFLNTVKPPKPARKDDAPPKTISAATITLNEGIRYRFNEIREDFLELWANPKAKAFAASAPDSADVAIAHSAMRGYSLDADGYNSRQAGLGYPGEVHFRLPAAPYARAVIDFVLDDADGKVPFLAVRMAKYNLRYGIGGTRIEDTDIDFTKGIPEGLEIVGEITRDGRKFPVYRTSVELPTGRSLELASGDFIDLDFLGPKDIRFQQLDYSKHPRSDVSSAFNLISVKLEKLNVLPEVVQTAPGNIFTEDEKIRKTSIRLTALTDGAKGTVQFGDEKPIAYSFAAKGETNTFDFVFSDAEIGFYDLPVRITDASGLAITHPARYCVTPSEGRLTPPQESPYATWWFIGTHGSPKEWDISGPVLRKAGIAKVDTRSATTNELQKYQVAHLGRIFALGMGAFDGATGQFKPGKVKRDGQMVEISGEEVFVDNIEKQMKAVDFTDHIMIWHESAPHCGIPQELLAMAAPTNDVTREKLTAAYINECGRIIRKHFPGLSIKIGNSGASIGAVAVPMRGGAKAEYYDCVGQESVSQTILPERFIDCAIQGQIVTKAIARKLSGKDIATDGCYEFIYRPERDLGYRGEDLQAEYHARDILISLMNNYKLISPGLLFDCDNAYTATVWGPSGILLRAPYTYPKKAYLAYAVATKVLDGVEFVRQIPTDSTTVYAAEFKRRDGKTATTLWCARGEASFDIEGGGELWTMYGKRSQLGAKAAVQCGTAPVYVISEKPLASLKMTGRAFAEDTSFAARAEDVTEFSADNLTVSPNLRFETKHNNFLPILKPGVFTVKDVEDETEGKCIEVTLDTSVNGDKITDFISEYTTLTLKEPVAIKGEPDLLGLRVKGNSNWGQLRFEIEDAEGEVFSGFSTGKSWGCDVYDWPGYTAVNFDGWNDIYQYTDENRANLSISPGPRDEQWVSGGGNKKIDFPVRLRAIHVVMNRSKVNILGFEPSAPSIRIKKAWALQK